MTKKIWSGQYDPCDRVPTCSGSKTKVKYHLEVDAKGVNVLVAEKEPFDWYGMIQASTDGCSLEKMLDRYRKTGDLSILNKRTGAYFDATAMPNSLIGMYKKIQEGERYFNELPLDIRQKFDNSFTKFLANNGCYKSDAVKSDSVKFDSVKSDSVKSEKNVKKESDFND